MAEESEIKFFTSEAELDALCRAFEEARIPRECWLHREHVAVATLFLLQQRGIDDIRSGIQKLNAANGVETTPVMGYHETITRFWAHLIGHRLTTLEGSRLEKVNAVLTEFSRKMMLFDYYSYDRAMSVEARATWVEPDLKSLP